ncbi:MAG: M23 family metallopeptidase, partial [Pseudomonadota bacterium]
IAAGDSQAGRVRLQTAMGDSPALLAGKGRRLPDRRRVSVRWLAGSVLTGVTSIALMGGALWAALDGRQQLANPARSANAVLALAKGDATAGKGDRPLVLLPAQQTNEKIMQVPTLTRTDGGNVIRKRPFAYAVAPLALVPRGLPDYPAFNPLNVFRASGSDRPVGASDVIYGADIESDVLLAQVDFPMDVSLYDQSARISPVEAEMIVRANRETLLAGETQIAAAAYVDDTRFSLDESGLGAAVGLSPGLNAGLNANLGIRITAENVSRAVLDDPLQTTDLNYSEEVVIMNKGQTLSDALSPLSLDPSTLAGLLEALAGEFGTDAQPNGTRLRVSVEETPIEGAATATKRLPRRISVYRGTTHLKSVALNDRNQVVWGNTPAPIPALSVGLDEEAEPELQTLARDQLPNAYDGIYRAALSQGLNAKQARRIIRAVAFDVDFKSKIKPSDKLEIFYSMEDDAGQATDASEILYIGLDLGGVQRSYYRFRSGDDGRVDFYNAEGKSAKKFLLRRPVPNSRFSSPFGPRRHPISRTYKMHWGADFSAPRGTPILAAGDGVVTQAKWNSGYGRQAIIRHANGYETSYSHMHRFAKGIKVGRRVRQGQIIGQVGSTGYSTGPHLHYEMKVNGRKVNPMKIRLPQGRSLKGAQLAAFKRERDRINALLKRGRGEDQVASLN